MRLRRREKDGKSVEKEEENLRLKVEFNHSTMAIRGVEAAAAAEARALKARASDVKDMQIDLPEISPRCTAPTELRARSVSVCLRLSL